MHGWIGQENHKHKSNLLWPSMTSKFIGHFEQFLEDLKKD